MWASCRVALLPTDRPLKPADDLACPPRRSSGWPSPSPWWSAGPSSSWPTSSGAGWPPAPRSSWRPTASPTTTTTSSRASSSSGLLVAALILLVIIAIGLPLYWLRRADPGERRPIAGSTTGPPRPASCCSSRPTPPLTPHPQANALPFGCATCHGTKGQGGSTNYSITDAAGKIDPGAVAGAGAQHRARPLHARHRAGHHHLRPGQHADAGLGRRRRRRHERPAALRPGRLPPDHPADARPQAKAASEPSTGTDGAGHSSTPTAPAATPRATPTASRRSAGGGAYGPNITGGSESASSPSRPTRWPSSPGRRVRQAVRGAGHRPDGRRHPDRSGDPGRGRPGGGMPFFAQHAHTRADRGDRRLRAGAVSVGGCDPPRRPGRDHVGPVHPGHRHPGPRSSCCCPAASTCCWPPTSVPARLPPGRRRPVGHDRPALHLLGGAQLDGRHRPGQLVGAARHRHRRLRLADHGQGGQRLSGRLRESDRSRRCRP